MLQLLDFYADWCGPCRIMEPIFDELGKEFTGKIEFKRVDVESDQEISSKFSVFSIPTFVLMEGDKEIDRKVGAMPKEVVKNWLAPHLK